MVLKNPELDSLERKVRSVWSNLTSHNCIWISGDNEANYLMSGHATEKLESIWLPNSYDNNAYAIIYGVVAANRSNGRYVWIYLHYRHHIWKCQNIKNAFDIVDKISEHSKLEKKLMRLRKKLATKSKLLSVCNN